MENTTQAKLYPFRFTGTGGGYFKVWLVNILLTIITVGIYSAWAKVRTNRYFYGHTTLHQASFEYLASPIQILKGRIIAITIFILYNFVASFNPLIGLGLLALFFLAMPYLIVRAITFQHRMTAYKNIRFDFAGRIGGAFMVYFIWPLLSLFTLGLLYPVAHQKLVKYYVSNSKYGQATFSNTSTATDFYKLYFILFFVVLGLVGVGVLVSSLITGLGGFHIDLEQLKSQTDGDMSDYMSFIYIYVAIYGLMFIFYFIVGAFMKATINNFIMSTTSLNRDIHFISDLSLPRMAWILFSNVLFIVCTFGLAYPWTKVRLAKYSAEHTQVLTSNSLDSFLGSDIVQSNAFGDEMSEVFDIDIGIT